MVKKITISEFWKAIFNRALRGAVTTAIPLLAVQVTSWKDLGDFLNGLLIALSFGIVSGTLLALDKAWRMGVN